MRAEKKDSSKLVDNSEDCYLVHTSFSTENYQHSEAYTVNSSTNLSLTDAGGDTRPEQIKTTRLSLPGSCHYH